MKIWFEYCHMDGFFQDADVKCGLGWYKHSPLHKWKGLTIQVYFFKWVFFANYVSDYAAYDKRMNYRYSDAIKEQAERRAKRLTNRLKKDNQ